MTIEPDTLALLVACCQALDNKKAEDLQVLHLGERSSITDFFVIATGTSDPHLRALRKTIDETCSQLGLSLGAQERGTAGGWSVVDAYDVVFHLFTDEQRSFYNLEALWKDATPVDWQALQSPVEAAPAEHEVR